MTNATLTLPSSMPLSDFSKLAARSLDVPVAFLSLVDANRRLVTSSHGLSAPLALLASWSFFQHLASSDKPLILTDGRADPMLARHSSVRERRVRAYVGMRLLTSDGRAVGTFSVMDQRPRDWSSVEIAFLRELCARIVDRMELGSALEEARGAKADPGRFNGVQPHGRKGRRRAGAWTGQEELTPGAS